MLYLIIALYTVFIFPISASTVLCAKFKQKKVYLGVFIYNFLPLIRGVIYLKEGGLYFLKRRKETKLELSLRNKIKAKIKPFYDFNVTDITFLYSFGGVSMPLYTIFLTSISKKIAKEVFRNIKPFLKINNYYDIYTEEKKFDVDIKIKMRFNLLVITLTLIKTFFNFISEKINEKSCKRRQNKTNNRVVA